MMAGDIAGNKETQIGGVILEVEVWKNTVVWGTLRVRLEMEMVKLEVEQLPRVPWG